VPTFGDSFFARTLVEAAALSGSSVRQGTRKTMPGESVRKLILVHTRESSGKEQSMKRNKTYEFSVVLTSPALSVAECDALYEAGCDDGTIVTRNGVTSIAFDRQADSLEKAIRAATADVRTAGFDVKRVEMLAFV
jgi:hypothetical protein